MDKLSSHPESEVLEFLAEVQVIVTELGVLLRETEREPVVAGSDESDGDMCIRLSDALATQLGTYLDDVQKRMGNIITTADTFRQGQQTARIFAMLGKGHAGN